MYADKSDRQLLIEIARDVSVLNAKWNGGPGQWGKCVDHERQLLFVLKRLSWMHRLVWMFIAGGTAGGAVAGWFIEHFHLIK
jgi:hypothetical protein